MPEEVFDPDKLYLTKAQILGIGDMLIEQWKKNEKANTKMIIIAKAAKFLAGREKAENLENYYKQFWKIAFKVMQNNAIMGDPTLQKVFLKTPPKPEPQEVVSELDFSLKKLAQVVDFGGMKDD